MLLSTTNRSILVIEDIDCGAELDYQRRQFDSVSILYSHKIFSNQIYEATATYLRSKIGDSSNLNHLRVSKTSRKQGLTADIVIGQSVMDSFQDINWLKWKLCAKKKKKKKKEGDLLLTYFELSFEKKFKEVMLNSYLPNVISCSKVIQEARKVVKLYSCDIDGVQTGREWYSIILEHPATFEKLAMDPEPKRRLIDDLDRFWYKKVGKAWKREYNLDISRIKSDDSDLKRILLSISNRSMMVIEDIDCALLEKRGEEKKDNYAEFTLSGLLNVIDGLWSNNGDGRIIEFTTNHKDQLDQLEHVILHHVWVQAVGFYLSLMVTTNSMDGLNHCLRKQRLPQLQLLRNFQGLKIPMLLLEELWDLSNKFKAMSSL
ncbi:aaa-atpase [Quercus suber]|uniref:Aaa-atpase n=1 Tax=Quercus suber TaxID=58331 RepID=A0AAW0JXE8_QUESU